MITALFGGSFDPVHKGHVNAVRSLISAFPETGRVIVMPARINPFKVNGAPPANGFHRLNMCRLAFENIPLCSVSDHELSSDRVSYTADTLEYLKELYPGDRLFLTVGSDSLESLPRWYRFESIIKNAEIAAAARSEQDKKQIKLFADTVTASGGTVHIIETRPFEISSTEIREKILNNEDITCYMDKNVVKYILKNDVYNSGQSPLLKVGEKSERYDLRNEH